MNEQHIPAAERAKLYRPHHEKNASVRVFVYEPIEIHIGGHSTGLFHYGRFIHPKGMVEAVGYCAQGCQGHSDPKAAREHYRQFLLDKQLGFYRCCDGPMGRCAVCGIISHRSAWITFDPCHLSWVFCLCLKHQTRANVERLFILDDFDLVVWHPDIYDDLFDF